MKTFIMLLALGASYSAFSSTLEDYLGAFKGKSDNYHSPECEMIVSRAEGDQVEFKITLTGTGEIISGKLPEARVVDILAPDTFRVFRMSNKINKRQSEEVSIYIVERYWDHSFTRPWMLKASTSIKTKGSNRMSPSQYIECQGLERK